MMVQTARTTPFMISLNKTTKKLVSPSLTIIIKWDCVNVLLAVAMFYIGSNVVAWPYGALRGVKDGHHIAGHTWSHKMMTTLTNQEILAELYYTAKAIKYVTGITPRYWFVFILRRWVYAL